MKVFIRPFTGPNRFARLVRAAGAAVKVFLRPFTGPNRFLRPESSRKSTLTRGAPQTDRRCRRWVRRRDR